MTAAAVPRPALALPLGLAAAILFGTFVGRFPTMAIGLAGISAIVVLAFAAPVTYLGFYVFMTLIFPFSIQNTFGIGGGTGAAGLIVSDVLLMIGLARALIVLSRRPLRAAEAIGAAVTLAFLGLCMLHFVQGAFWSGNPLAEAGNDLRALLGYGALLVALPIVLDPTQHQRLLRAMVVIGLLLGLWGIIQWSGNVPYNEAAGDYGVRKGVRLTSSGAGQLQGGLYGYPVAVTLGFAALVSGEIVKRSTRILVAFIVALNGVDVVLTFERTFIVVTLFGCAVVALRAGHVQRWRALLLGPVALIAVLVPLAALSPESLTTARERLLSIGQYGSDDSVRYRLTESQHAIVEIKKHPWTGNGLGASIWWGRPENDVPPTVNYFIHNGYLWHAWKLGIPTALVLLLGILLAVLRPRKARGSPAFAATVTGAAAIVLGLLIASVTFPAITSRPITPVLGILLAMCLAPRLRRDEMRAGAPAPLAS